MVSVLCCVSIRALAAHTLELRMIAKMLEILFTPAVILATKLSGLLAPPARPLQGYRMRPQFRTASRRIRKVS